MRFINQLINDYNHLSPVYAKSEYANHLPMSLYAMNEMGASRLQLTQFAELSIKQNQLKPYFETLIKIDEQSFNDYLGQPDQFSAYVHFFEREWEALGKDILISTYLTFFASSIGAASFHCLIRLSFAVEADNMEEITCALAYFAVAYSPNPSLDQFSKSEDWVLGDIISQLEEDDYLLSKPYDGDSINTRMKAMSSDVHFCSLLTIPDLSVEDAIEELAGAFKMIYLHTQNFTTLHLITSAYALRVLNPYLEEKTTFLSEYWVAAMTAYASTGFTGDQSIEICDDVPEWNLIFEKANKSADDHTIKFVYVCHQENNYYNDAVYYDLACSRIR